MSHIHAQANIVEPFLWAPSLSQLVAHLTPTLKPLSQLPAEGVSQRRDVAKDTALPVGCDTITACSLRIPAVGHLTIIG